LGTGKLAEYWRAAWEESYASYAAHACGGQHSGSLFAGGFSGHKGDMLCLSLSCIGGAIRDATFGVRAPMTRMLEAALVTGSTGDIHYEGGVRIIENCGGLGRELLRLFGSDAFTIGHTICSAGRLSNKTKKHEKRHVTQYDILGDAFLPIYFGPANFGALVECSLKGGLSASCIHDKNVLERQAGPDQ